MWFAEPKYNGWRVLAHAPTGTCFNRHGALLTIAHEFAALGRGTLVVLDTTIAATYIQRQQRLLSAFQAPLTLECKPPVNTVLINLSFAANDAAVTYEKLRAINSEWRCDFYEGLAMERADADYPVQLRGATEKCRA